MEVTHAINVVYALFHSVLCDHFFWCHQITDPNTQTQTNSQGSLWQSKHPRDKVQTNCLLKRKSQQARNISSTPAAAMHGRKHKFIHPGVLTITPEPGVIERQVLFTTDVPRLIIRSILDRVIVVCIKPTCVICGRVALPQVMETYNLPSII